MDPVSAMVTNPRPVKVLVHSEQLLTYKLGKEVGLGVASGRDVSLISTLVSTQAARSCECTNLETTTSSRWAEPGRFFLLVPSHALRWRAEA